MSENLKYCNFEPGQSQINGLTCEKWALKEVKVLSFDEALGQHLKESIWRCFKCKRPWKTFEKYDSHHGYWRKALKLNGSGEFNGKIVNFHKDEIKGLDLS